MHLLRGRLRYYFLYYFFYYFTFIVNNCVQSFCSEKRKYKIYFLYRPNLNPTSLFCLELIFTGNGLNAPDEASSPDCN